MSFPISATNIYSLLSLSGMNINYFNTDRLFNTVSSVSAIDGYSITLYDIFSNIKDVNITDNALILLTDKKSLSSVFNNSFTISSDVLGTDGISKFNSYYFNSNKFSYNYDTTVKEQKDIQNYNLVIIPYHNSDNYAVIPLKTYTGVNNEYDYTHVTINRPTRNYTGLYESNDTVYAQFKYSHLPIEFKPDSEINIYLPDNIRNFNFSNREFIYNDAIGGDRPINSDIIYMDQYGYSDSTNHGAIDSNKNGEMLCVWLSANSCSGASYQWMERWYDPATIKQGDAFIATVNTLSSDSSIFDIPSTITFKSKNHFKYNRMGPDRNANFIDSLSSNLIAYFQTWGNSLSSTVGQTKGFSIPERLDESEEIINMDGTQHFHIPPNDDLFINNMTFGGWVYQDKWSCGIDTQYFGNFSNNEGYGLFFNTSAPSELITLPTLSGYVYGFNNRGFRVFEKSITNSIGVSSAKLDNIATDLFGARWIYDSLNKKIYKLDTDDLLKTVIDLPINTNISKMEINSQNELYVMNTKNRSISGFDTNGTLIYGPYTTYKYNNFVIDQNDVIKYKTADIALIDNNNATVIAIGINIYKNDQLFYHVGDKIQAMTIDSNNNIWVVCVQNRLLKIDANGFLLFDKQLPVFFEDTNSIELSFTKEIKNGCDSDVLWAVFNDYNYILKINEYGDIIKRIDVKNVINLKDCKTLQLNVRGDFTGYYTKRKYSVLNSQVISSSNPAITLKINLSCGTNKKIIQIHTNAKYLREWNHLAFSHFIGNNNTYLSLYINGIKVATKTVSGTYFIDYGTKVSPFIIGGHSGKLGAKNIERSLNSEGYFKGKLAKFRLYKSVLNSFELRGLSNELISDNFPSMIWYMPIPNTTFIESIESYNLNRYKGHKSNKFNIVIRNLTNVSDEVKSLITSIITNSVDKICPANTELNEIRFI